MKTIFVVGARGIPDVEGGVEKSAERVFPHIAAGGWRVILAGLSDNICATEFKDVELWAAPTIRVLNTDKLFYYLCAIFHALRIQPDIVHLNGLGSALFLWAYKLMGCKIVVRYGSADYLLDKWGMIGKVGFRVAEYQLRYADAIIVVAPALVERLKARGILNGVHLIPNAIDRKADFESNSVNLIEGPYVLSVGRVTAQKNFHRLIEGFQKFALVNPNIKLVIAGSFDDQKYHKRLQALLSDNIIMLGNVRRSNLANLYANASLYINSSLHEGHSNAVLEAICFSCPILLSDITENRDFKFGNHQYFDPASLQSLTSALSRAHANPEQYIVTSKNLMSWEDVAEKTKAVYRQLYDRFPAHTNSECGP